MLKSSSGHARFMLSKQQLHINVLTSIERHLKCPFLCSLSIFEPADKTKGEKSPIKLENSSKIDLFTLKMHRGSLEPVEHIVNHMRCGLVGFLYWDLEVPSSTLL